MTVWLERLYVLRRLYECVQEAIWKADRGAWNLLNATSANLYSVQSAYYYDHYYIFWRTSWMKILDLASPQRSERSRFGRNPNPQSPDRSLRGLHTKNIWIHCQYVACLRSSVNTSSTTLVDQNVGIPSYCRRPRPAAATHCSTNLTAKTHQAHKSFCLFPKTWKNSCMDEESCVMPEASVSYPKIISADGCCPRRWTAESPAIPPVRLLLYA